MTIFDAVQAFAAAIRGDIADTNSNLLTSFSPSASATNTPADAATAGAAIRAAVSGGYTLQTFTSSDAAWTVPPDLASATEAYAGACNGGGKGNPGATNNINNQFCLGGSGGRDGGYRLEKFDPSTLGSTLNVTIGAAASTDGADGGATSIVDGATTLVTATAGEGSIATPQGYVPANSKPGSGGAGGDAGIGATPPTDAVDGESSATALGGAGGALITGTSAGTGNTGSAGGTGQTATLPICGGGGGGGGGSRSKTSIGGSVAGGAGGNGGFPGGASGGGGAAQSNSGSTTGGAAGTPANGFGFIFWR